jgi:3-oxoacyl-[acyl-carrier protein] reductase
VVTADVTGIEDDYVDNTPLGRAGTPDEVAEAVVYTTRAAWLTGATLDLNGGAHLKRHPDLVGHVGRAFG